MRPPSRHKDPPQNIGLDLPPDEDDLPSLDEDSDSSDQFEIGIENAGGLREKKLNIQLDNKLGGSNTNPTSIKNSQTQPHRIMAFTEYHKNRDSDFEDNEP